MQKSKFLGLLGICRKAGKLCTGSAKATESVTAKKAYAVFVAADISAKTEKELNFKAKDTQAAVLRTPFTIEEISKSIGIQAGVVAIEDEGFAKALNVQLQGGESVYDD